jgi:hypothetical protein
VTVAPSDEKSLPAAIDNLYSAIGALIDPRKELISGTLMAAPSLYESLVNEIPASTGEFSGKFHGASRPPVWVDALDLRIQIDSRIKEWQPKGDSTPARLRALASQRWRPQDGATIRDYANDLRGWALTIKSYLDPEHIKGVSAACPTCGTRWVYRQHAGESVRQPALQLIVRQGCTCLACDSFWEPSRYLFLCRLLGFELPPGVLV